MSVHINITVVKISLGPKGARIGVGAYRRNADGSTQRLTIGGQQASIELVKEGETFVVNLPEEGDSNGG